LRNDNYAAALDMIAAEAPDVVGLAEVDAAWVAGLSALKARYPYSVERPQEGAFGLLLYSRFPIRETEGSPLVQDGIQAAISVETELLGEPVNLVVAHLMAPMSGARAELRNAQIKK